jgi:DNA repair protein RAD51
MSNEEEQYEEGTMGAPGAPTPVSALEVCVAGATTRA